MSTELEHGRWGQVLTTLAAILPAGSNVLIDSPRPDTTRLFRDRLAAVLSPASLRGGGRDVVIWLRTEGPHPGPSDTGEEGADIIVDVHDADWPIIRSVDETLAPPQIWYRTESQAFFAVRAASWDARFGDDIPAYTQAIQEARIAPGGVAIDVGCGTGRALPPLRDAVGPHGVVIGVDHTREMLDVARTTGRALDAHLLLAAAENLPIRDGAVNAVFAAGLITHLPDITAGLAELARVTAPHGRLILFHPTGRAALATRQGRTVAPDDPLNEPRLADHLTASGWHLTRYDDSPHRFLALAARLPACRADVA